ncbi:MAG TPA: TatD family hydrolase [Armatimonadota bacterium]|jgi:TatD DNase family protein
MIDAHTHLNDPRLLPEIDPLLARMLHAGVTGALVVGYDLASSRTAVDLAARYPQYLRAAIGVHPHDSKDVDQETLTALRALAQQPGVVAYGEIGLDFYYDHSPRDVQRDAFGRQLALAVELELPIIIHEREAVDEVMAVLDAEGGWALGGAWHCCSVAPQLAVQIAQSFYVGIAGWITFAKGDNIRALAQAVPLARLLLETDAPYITPVPYRGKPNEPSYVRLTAQALANVKGISLADVEEMTMANTRQAFPRWGDTEPRGRA